MFDKASIVTMSGIVVLYKTCYTFQNFSSHFLYLFFIGPCCTKDFINLKASVVVVSTISLNFSYMHAIICTMLPKPHVFLTIALLDSIFKTGKILLFCNIPSATRFY